MDRLFLDANVLFTAAHRASGKAAFLFNASREATPERRAPWVLISSDYAIGEARRNLGVKFPPAVAVLDTLVERIERVPQPPHPVLPLALPHKDVPIWAAAHAARATHLLTGDLRDFGPHMNRPEASGGVVIQTVGDYLADWSTRRA